MTSSARESRAGRGGSRPHQFGINLIVAALAAVPCSTYEIGLSAADGTATMISVTVNHHQTVDIAPAVVWMWSNAYRSFNVDAAGSLLNDIGIKIRTIVKQLEGGNRRIISGRIDVTGLCASMTLANSCGITMKGGSYINTGRVSYKAAVSITGTPAQFDVQRNCVDSGVITRST